MTILPLPYGPSNFLQSCKNIIDKINEIIAGDGGGVQSVNSGTDITVDNTDPLNPVVNYTGTIITNGYFLQNVVAAGSVTITHNANLNPGYNIIVTAGNFNLAAVDYYVSTATSNSFDIVFNSGSYTGLVALYWQVSQ